MSGRIIFLDIDGVILPTRMWAAPGNLSWLGAPPVERSPHLTFDPGAVGLLIQLAQLTGARFVLHSNWRRHWPKAQRALLEMLVRSGLTLEFWHEAWSVPSTEGRDKAREISEWLELHRTVSWRGLIIDDVPLGPLDVVGRFEVAQLRPSRDEGFGMADYRAALAFFETSDPRVTNLPVAPLCAVEVRRSSLNPAKGGEDTHGTAKNEAIAYLRKALVNETPWEEFRDVVTALPDAWVFEAYFPFAVQSAPGSTEAVAVLDWLAIGCLIPCKDAVRSLLDEWNTSFAAPPYYLSQCFGRKGVQAAIRELEQESLTGMQREALHMVAYLTSPDPTGTQHYQPLSREHRLRQLERFWSRGVIG